MRRATALAALALVLSSCGSGTSPPFSYAALRGCFDESRLSESSITPSMLGSRTALQHTFRITFPFEPAPVTTDDAVVVVAVDRSHLDHFVEDTLAAYQRQHPELQKATAESSERGGVLIRRNRVFVLWNAVHPRSRQIVERCLDRAHA